MDGAKYRYLKNYTTGALTAYLAYTYDPDTWTVSAALTTTVAASGEAHKICVPQVAVTQGTSSTSYYFWAFVGPGEATFTSAAAIGAQAKLFTTATAGKIDDNSSSTVLIPGLVTYDAFASYTCSMQIKTLETCYVCIIHTQHTKRTLQICYCCILYIKQKQRLPCKYVAVANYINEQALPLK